MMILQRSIAVVLCSLLVTLPAMSEPQAGGSQSAGQITAMIPSATLNSKEAKTQEGLNWNDLLQTEHSGRVRAGLTDGSILSLGSDSQLRIVQHDATAQQTSLEMDYGKVRSQVVKITRPGGKFETKTPNAVIGVIGTDFYVGYEANRTTVICYKGRVSVTPTGNATVTNTAGQTTSSPNSVTLDPGQMVVITSEIPPAGFQSSTTPPDVLQASLTATDINVNAGGGSNPTEVAKHGHTLRWVLVGTAVAVGLGLGLGLSQSGGGGRKVVTNPGN
ncbi:MAG TPA: FecR family protein [Candidatus Acidoferrales bacterium]